MAPFTLYHHPYSSRSLMVRYALAIAGQPANEASRIDLSLEVVDIMNCGQLDETFLCEINPKGQVPVLTSPTLAAALPECVEITHFICKRYPSLSPSLHRESIQSLLNDLHELSFFALSFLEKPFVADITLRGIDDRLSNNDISDRYRKALKYKHAVNTKEELNALQPDFVARNQTRTEEVLKKFASLLPPSTPSSSSSPNGKVTNEGGPWLFGLKNPTALDAHTVVFVARLKDVGRHQIVPARLLAYAESAWETEAYKAVMQGRKTMIGV